MQEIKTNHVMLDLETMGNRPNSAIIAIGAVRFDGISEIGDSFHVLVDLTSSVEAGLEMDADTVMWWMKQSDEARKQFEQPGAPLREALEQFTDWIGEGAKVWGNGVAFDNVILKNAYQKCGMEAPWSPLNDRCYRTVKNLHPEVGLERIGTLHCAVDDAKSQAIHLMRMPTRKR